MSLSETELALLKDVVSLPTAPFCESHVQAYVRDWAEQTGLSFQQDKSGNILLTYPGKGQQSGNPWVLQAHMDHPGFSVISRRGKLVQAWFRGGVQESYFPDARVQFFPTSGTPVSGTVQTALRDKTTGFLRCRIELDQVVPLPRGTFGMWNLQPWRKSGERLSVRVADDLCGVASILTAFTRLKERGCKRRVYGLLTRAEEVGFVGAIAAAKNKLIDPAWPVLGIEASKAQPNAKIGQGAVVRVGDATTVFNPQLTSCLRKKARELMLKKDSGFNYVESLMPGGSTESTGLAVLGYETCALCLPLGNYHNMGKSGIAPEQISLNDYESLVELLAETVQQSPNPALQQGIKKRLLENYKKRAPLL